MYLALQLLHTYIANDLVLIIIQNQYIRSATVRKESW